jgi:hypothetical protein
LESGVRLNVNVDMGHRFLFELMAVKMDGAIAHGAARFFVGFPVKGRTPILRW